VEGIDEKVYSGIANIGVRPTVDGKEPLLEVHVFDFDGNLYNKLLTIKFKQKLREEKTFESIDALKIQIEKDLVEARSWLAKDRGDSRRIAGDGDG
jgi:riboflavin kinase/FMN adenylyltransferase